MAAGSDDSTVDALVAEAILAAQRGDRAAVEALCAAHADRSAEIRSSLERLAHLGLLDGSRQRRPERIGRYRLVETLGRGGMGVVYRAVQEDDIAREVAVKVIGRAGSTAIAARFRRERRTLGRLQHPNIAQLFDAGETDAGEPYFVMELVRGLGLIDYADQQRLAVRARVELMAEVCDAVAHAHLKGVVHRDLKPSNILVQQQPGQRDMPKVIDFGIAKLLDEDSDGAGAGLVTVEHSILGTPEYMSPEQARGEVGHIDTRTDVYALGIVLYELLTGARPHDLDGVETPFALAAVLDRPVPRPSTRTAARETAARRQATASGLRRLLRGDLDWVVLRAMAPEIDRRYASAAELAAELRRYLASEPVLAGPPTAIYRLGKLARRHKAITAAVASLAVGFVVSVALFIEARAAQRLAEDRALEAEAIAGFVERLVGSADPAQGATHDMPLARLLRRSSAAIESEFADRPAVRARFLARLGRVHGALDVNDRALGMLDAALSTWDGVGLPHDEAWMRARLVRAAAAAELGRVGEAVPALREIVRDLRRRPDLATVLPEALSLLGWHSARIGDRDAADRCSREAVELARKVPGIDATELAAYLNRHGGICFDEDQFETARTRFEEAVTVAAAAGAAGDAIRAMVLTNLVRTLAMLGRSTEALEQAERGFELGERVYGRHHKQRAFLLAASAVALSAVGRQEEALAALRDAVAIGEAVLPPDDLNLAWLQADLAAALSRQGRWHEAATYHRAAADCARRATRGAAHRFLPTILLSLADSLRHLGRLDDAGKLVDEAEHAAAALPEGTVSGQICLARAAQQMAAGDPAAAAATIEAGLTQPLPPAQRAKAICQLAYCRNLAGQAALAEAAARQAIEASAAGVEPSEHAAAQYQLGWALSTMGQNDAAVTALRECLAELKQFFPAGHWTEPYANALLGQLLYRAGDSNALGFLTAAVAGFEICEGRTGRFTVVAIHNQAKALLAADAAGTAQPLIADGLARLAEAGRAETPLAAALNDRAAEAAQALGDLDAAVRHARQAAAIHDALGSALAARIDARLRIADLQQRCGDDESARSTRAEAARLAAEADDGGELRRRVEASGAAARR